VILSHVILSHAPSLCSKSRKEKKRKRKVNINNDLAVLPSHDKLHRLSLTKERTGDLASHSRILGRFLLHRYPYQLD